MTTHALAAVVSSSWTYWGCVHIMGSNGG